MLNSEHRSEAAIADYLSTKVPKCLQIGAGFNILPGWLNMDLEPQAGRSFFLDATRPFPIPDNSLDFIFSEHTIEHIPYAGGRAMLAECYRVLRPGGVVRISTPNLRTLVGMLDRQSETEAAWLKWQHETFAKWAPRPDPVFIVNNFVRDWGHQFIYDERALREAMELAGFFDTKKCALNESDHAQLRGLENESRMAPGFLKLETMTFEGTK